MSTDNSSEPRLSRNILLVWIAVLAIALALLAAWVLTSINKTPTPTPVRVQATPITTETIPMRPAPPVPSLGPDRMGGHVDPAEQAQQQLKVFSGFESRFRADTQDAHWSVPAENSLVETASEPALTATGVPEHYYASCSAHMCKISMTFANRNQADDWSDFYPVGMAGTVTTVQSMVSARPDGKFDLIMYATRQGSDAMLLDPSQAPKVGAAAPAN